MNTRGGRAGVLRRLIALFGVVTVAVGVPRGWAQVETPGDHAVPTTLIVTTEPGDGGDTSLRYRLSISGDSRTAGPAGVFYRTNQPISHMRIIEVEPPAGRVIPPGSNARTQLALWNELGADGKLWPHSAVRHAGADTRGNSASPPANWSDFNHDGVADLGFVCIGDVDYELALVHGRFNPVPLSDEGPTVEPWPTTAPDVPPGLHAGGVPAYDRDGDGIPDHSGYAQGGCYLYVVQFVTQPLDEFRVPIQRLGGIIREYMESNCYVIEMTADVRNEVAALPFVRWTGPLHPAWRLAPSLADACFDADGQPRDVSAKRYAISVFERGYGQRTQLARTIERQGGSATIPPDGGSSLVATLVPRQMLTTVQSDSVLWVSVYEDLQDGSPGRELAATCNSTDPIAYQLTGIDCLASAPFNFRGQGVRGAVWGENRFRLNALDYNRFGGMGNAPPYVQAIGMNDGGPHIGGSHGTSVFGLIFGRDPGSPSQYQGILADAELGVYGAELITIASRIPFTEEEACPLEVVFQSSSRGSSLAPDYDVTTRDLDDVVLRKDILVCQMTNETMSDTDPCPYGLMSREAWAKNVVTVGGVKCMGTPTRSDDSWGGISTIAGKTGTGLGPDEHRIKPDLVHVYDGTRTVTVFCPFTQFPCVPQASQNGCGQTCEPGNGCTDPSPFFLRRDCFFGGASAATPITAGCFGLLFQMWHQQVFPCYGGAATVYASRPHAATAKAMMINTAFQYPILASAPPCSTTPDFTRMNHGWGMPCLKARAEDAPHLGLYDLRNSMLIINEDFVLTTAGQTVTFPVTPLGTMPLKATLVYTDPAGNPATGGTRVNDLNLQVTSPSGVNYFGNSGLLTSNWSAAGGSADKYNTVENVFIQSPAAGTWYVAVTVQSLNGDARIANMCTNPQSGPLDVDFALVVSGISGIACSRTPDWNRDGVVDMGDVFDFLTDYMSGAADYDSDGMVGIVDLDQFLTTFMKAQRP